MTYALPTPAEFIDYFGEFTNVNTAKIQIHIDLVDDLDLVCAKLFKKEEKYKYAVALIAAHFLSKQLKIESLSQDSNGLLSNQSDQLIASESVGDVSISFDNSIISQRLSNAKKDEITQDYMTTDYGRRYMMILRTVASLAATTNTVARL